MTAWDPAALDDLASYGQVQRTTGLLVVQNGRTVLERNWPLPAGSELFAQRYLHGQAGDGAMREDVASQQKSVVSLLAAIAVDRGLLDLERPVSTCIGRGWSRAEPTQEDAILVRHLLEMCSGLDDTLCFAAPAGTRHRYNTPAYALMLPVLEAAADQSMAALTLSLLTGPAGMADTVWCQRSDELGLVHVLHHVHAFGAQLGHTLGVVFGHPGAIDLGSQFGGFDECRLVRGAQLLESRLVHQEHGR